MDPTSYALLLALVLSKEELRFEFCHEQGYDTSCGLTVAEIGRASCRERVYHPV